LGQFARLTALIGALLAGTEAGQTASPQPETDASQPVEFPRPWDLKKTEAEVAQYYDRAHPELKEYILWTAKTFGPGRMWLQEDAFSGMPPEVRERKIQHLATLLAEGEYGRHLCAGLAEASALKDPRLVPGLLKVASYHLVDRDYDCRAKWMAVAALARQEGDAAVPVLISLVDHGNQNTRHWARAALFRKTGQDFKQDKPSWAGWWQSQGHPPLSAEQLKPWVAPPPATK
jgi:hypothetical protein